MLSGGLKRWVHWSLRMPASTTHWMLPELAEIRAFVRRIREEDQAARQAKQQPRKQRPTIPEDMQAPVQSEQSLVQSEQSLVQSETVVFQSGTQSGVLSGETSGLLSGDGKAGDSASLPDLPENPFSFHETLEDPKAKAKAGQVLEPEVLPPLSVGDEEAAQSRHYDVTSPSPKERREARIEEQHDAEVRRWEAEERAKARKSA